MFQAPLENFTINNQDCDVLQGSFGILNSDELNDEHTAVDY